MATNETMKNEVPLPFFLQQHGMSRTQVTNLI